jgi:hypothetical protein
MNRDIETIGLVAVMAFASSDPALSAVGEFSVSGGVASISSRDRNGDRVPFVDLVADGDSIVALRSSPSVAFATVTVGTVDRSSDDRITFPATVSTGNPPFSVGDEVTLCLVKASSGPSPAAASWTEAEIDFGAVGVWSAEFTVVDASVSASSKVIATESGKTATGGAAGEQLWDQLILSADPGAGQFNLMAVAVPGPVSGKRVIQYSVTS